MRKTWLRGICALGLATSVSGLATSAPVAADADAAHHGGACIAHRFYYSETADYSYAPGCTGHDEPELDPVSDAPGSARDLTWNIVLPANGTYNVDSTGPTFWFGGTVNDPVSLFGQAYLELQFYPNSILSKCTPGGGYKVTYAPDTYTACSPVWKIQDDIESAAFNAMITNGAPGQPLVMHAGDRVSIHFFVTQAKDGWHITVTDRTTHQTGTITVISPTDGPLMPSYARQVVGKSLKWGIVHDTPAAFVWEIGHTGNFTSPPGQFCVPGQTFCGSYESSWWAGTSPIQIRSVVFGDGSRATRWAAASDYGGAAEVTQYCHIYGGPFCIYPWYTWNGHAFSYGVNYPDTVRDFGQAAQFATTTQCGGPYGPKTTYCTTMLKPGLLLGSHS